MSGIPYRLWLFILAITIVRLIIASSIELGNDEVYYWTYAMDLQWNYFDHPPFIAWLIRATTANLLFHNETAVRLGAIISSAICTLLVYRIGQFLLNKRVGWYAVLLYSSSLYGSIIAGTFILPDSPQMVFWLWSIFLLLKISKSLNNSSPNLGLWCAFGITTGLCIMCKVHGIFIWLGLLFLALFTEKRIFRQKGFYLSILISLIICTPLIIWNIQHNFITYTYHSNRVSLFHSGINPLTFTREIFGAVFYNNPVVFFLVWTSLFSILRKKHLLIKKEVHVLISCSLPLIFTLLTLAVFRDTLPHWSGPAYSALIFLSAMELESYPIKKAKVIIASSLAVFVVIITAGIPFINFFPGTLSKETAAMKLGKGDPSLDLYGWKETGKIIDSISKNDKTGKIKWNANFIVVTKWFPAAHLDFYVAPKTSLTTFGLGQIFDLHQYYWSNQTKMNPKAGDNAYYIIPSNLYDESDLDFIKSKFETCSRPILIPIYRNGVVCKNILFFRLRKYKKDNGAS